MTMALSAHKYYSMLAFAIILSSLAHFSAAALQPTISTWYGPPNGAGSTGGACEFEDRVLQPPYSSLVSAGGPALYQGGKGCGTCYEIQCSSNPACSGQPVRVTITDECPGCSPNQFDLSGVAFGSLAKPGQADQLRNAGKIDVQFQRVPCNYPKQSIVFKVDKGSTPFFFATAILYENGDGDLASVDIAIGGSNQFTPMTRVSGATFRFNPNGSKGPYSIRLTSGESKKTIVAANVIPQNWTPGTSYNSNANF